jgi:hypothetical protein
MIKPIIPLLLGEQPILNIFKKPKLDKKNNNYIFKKNNIVVRRFDKFK